MDWTDWKWHVIVIDLIANLFVIDDYFRKPFNARAGHHSGWHFFGYNSPATIARELFKSSTDAASLLGSIKKIFWFRWGVCLVESRKVEVFLDFWPTLTGPERQSNGSKFYYKLFLETTWSSASIDPLIDLLACLEPTLWPKNHFATKIRKCMSLPLAATVAQDNPW